MAVARLTPCPDPARAGGSLRGSGCDLNSPAEPRSSALWTGKNGSMGKFGWQPPRCGQKTGVGTAEGKDAVGKVSV